LRPRKHDTTSTETNPGLDPLTSLNAVGVLLAAKPSPYQLLSGENRGMLSAFRAPDEGARRMDAGSDDDSMPAS